MGRAALWLSGVDQQLLSQCTRLQQSERIKFAGIGVLVLIPAILGLFSMTYAISTVSKNPVIFITGGVIWSFIILSIDRFVVSTVYKSALKDSKSYRVALISRYLLAIFVGIAVSHPLVLLWFNDSISQRVEEKRRGAVSNRRKVAEADLDKLANSRTQEELRNKNNYLDCMNSIFIAEQSGGEPVQLWCGSSSGINGCKDRCNNIKERIKKLDEEIQLLNNQVAREEEQAVGQREAIKTQAGKDVGDIEKGFSKDYLARVDALAEIEKDKSHVTHVKWFILFFFIFVEILPLTLKVTTPIGEYEHIRDTLLLQAKLNQEMERVVIKAITTDDNYINMNKAKFNYDRILNEAIGITQAMNDFMRKQERERETFDQQIKEISGKISKVKDAEIKKNYQFYLIKARAIFNKAWRKSIDRFNNYIQRQ